MNRDKETTLRILAAFLIALAVILNYCVKINRMPEAVRNPVMEMP